jgi:hypothetical protein
MGIFRVTELNTTDNVRKKSSHVVCISGGNPLEIVRGRAEEICLLAVTDCRIAGRKDKAMIKQFELNTVNWCY